MSTNSCLWNRAELMEKANRIFYVCSENEFFKQDTTIRIGKTIFDDEYARMHYVERFKNKTNKILFNKDYCHNLDIMKTKKKDFILPRDIKIFLEILMTEKNEEKMFLKNLNILIMSKIYRYKLIKINNKKFIKHQKEDIIPDFPYELIENILVP